MLYVRVPAPTPSRYGLLSSAVTVDEPNPHWMLEGVQFEPLGCGPARALPGPCVDETPPNKQSERGVPLVTAEPFVVYKGIECSAPSMTDPVLRDRVTSELALGESRAAEAVFWDGAVEGGVAAVEPNLSSSVVPLASDPLTATGAFAVLESAMGDCYGGDAYIHVPKGALAAMAERGYIVRDGNRLRTLAGSIVVVGAGYPGTDPDGDADDGVAWVYATGTVFVWRGPVSFTAGEPREYIARATNDAALVAERSIALAWDCCQDGDDLVSYGVPVLISGTGAATPGS